MHDLADDLARDGVELAKRLAQRRPDALAELVELAPSVAVMLADVSRIGGRLVLRSGRS